MPVKGFIRIKKGKGRRVRFNAHRKGGFLGINFKNIWSSIKRLPLKIEQKINPDKFRYQPV